MLQDGPRWSSIVIAMHVCEMQDNMLTSAYKIPDTDDHRLKHSCNSRTAESDLTDSHDDMHCIVNFCLPDERFKSIVDD